MVTITIFIITSTIIFIITILLIFIGVEYQLGHRPVFLFSCWCYFSFLLSFLLLLFFVHKTNSIKLKLKANGYQAKSDNLWEGTGSRAGAVVRALASHQCVPSSIPGPGVICGLSLLLVFYSTPRGFSPGTPVFPFPYKPTFLNSNSIWTSGTFVMSLWLAWSRKHSLCLTLNLHLHLQGISSIARPPKLNITSRC